MEFTFVISITTALIALVGAIIAAFFSYFSSKQNTKVQAMQAYLQFLQKKMDKLEGVLKTYDDRSELSEKDFSNELSNSIQNGFRMSSAFLEEYSYLFNHTDHLYKEITKEKEMISLSYGVYLGEQKGMTYAGKKEELIPKDDLLKKMITFKYNVRHLIENELECTFNKFEELSILK